MTEDILKIDLGGVEYRAKPYSAGPDRRYMLEVGGRHGSGYEGLLLIEQFADMRVQDLPEGLHISLQHPNTPLRLLESFTILCGKKRAKASFTLFYSPDDWHQPKNLWLFTKELSGKLLGELIEANRASVGKDQGHTWIDIELDFQAKEEIRSYLIDLENRIQLIIQRALKESTETKAEVHSSLRPDEKGFKWWLRYIIVPVLGSASLIGLIKFFAEKS